MCELAADGLCGARTIGGAAAQRLSDQKARRYPVQVFQKPCRDIQ